MNLNPQWNTPPNGDFARYVEQLSARAALSLRTASANAEHGLDVGMPPSAEPHAGLPPGAVAPRRRGTPPRPAATTAAGLGHAASSPPHLVRVLGIGWLLVLVGLFLFDAPFGVILLVLGGGIWLAKQLRSRLLPAGTASWSQWFQEAARHAAEKQRQQQQGK